ncbi:retrovirus-related Pol polyprotein from transposon 17.6 [Trichonephila clavipes]|nr:retrovirus-related Pol polyprotein from transposon 17.6 [Trichonephila clavipes]
MAFGVLDFRKLNEITITQDFVIPTLDDILHEVSGSNYLSALDMKSAFNQIPLHFRDRHATAFSTPDGDKYEFNRLCFGFKNSPKAFHSIAQEILGDLLHNGALGYVDDIILFSKTIEEHSFSSAKRYIKNFAKRALPLSNLLRKDTTFEWTSETQALFDDLKNAILNLPVLALPDSAAALQIKTDASCKGIGVVLEQRFVEWAPNEIAVVPDFHKRILFSDEAHFRLNGYVNKQNCCIWNEANLQVYVETPLHPEKLTVWCALWAGGIIGPYFFKHDEGHNVRVNGDRYRAMITSFFIPELNNHDVQELWFQQDGATCHTARATIDLLKDTFGDRRISRFGPVNWPP